MDHKRRVYLEAQADSWTHGVGLALSIAGLIALIFKSEGADALTWFANMSFGISMIILYAASTAYHASPSKRARRALKTLDHSAIFILIAGTYTPYLLITLRTPFAIGLMIFLWVFALAGIILKVFYVYKYPRLSTAMYLLMGWMAVLAIYPLVKALDVNAIWLLALGGLFYSAGVYFYSQKWMYAHAIWHVFVMAGTASHFASIYLYVEPVLKVAS